MRSPRRWLLLAAAVLIATVAMYWAVPAGKALLGGLDRESVESVVASAGPWGPALIVGLMTLAVVMSPIPSAPIALAAGAAYGHLWGTVYTLAGAELGALIAFALARILGRETLRQWFGEKLDVGLLGSQNVLMVTVFASRLMPFISFDLISYAAGLSCLALWRFALATLAGIIPASFILAHFGGAMADADMIRAGWMVLALGAVTGLPVLVALIRRHLRNRRAGSGAGRGNRKDLE